MRAKVIEVVLASLGDAHNDAFSPSISLVISRNLWLVLLSKSCLFLLWL